MGGARGVAAVGTRHLEDVADLGPAGPAPGLAHVAVHHEVDGDEQLDRVPATDRVAPTDRPVLWGAGSGGIDVEGRATGSGGRSEQSVQTRKRDVKGNRGAGCVDI